VLVCWNFSGVVSVTESRQLDNFSPTDDLNGIRNCLKRAEHIDLSPPCTTLQGTPSPIPDDYLTIFFFKVKIIFTGHCIHFYSFSTKFHGLKLFVLFLLPRS
jgi:hypothetical protein